jgi:hypothetical protein
VDYDPISVALKFGFLAVLYLFLLGIARSALKDLRGTVAPAPDATGFHSVPAFGDAAPGGDAAPRKPTCGSRTVTPPACTRGSSPAMAAPTSKT